MGGSQLGHLLWQAENVMLPGSEVTVNQATVPYAEQAVQNWQTQQRALVEEWAPKNPYGYSVSTYPQVEGWMNLAATDKWDNPWYKDTSVAMADIARQNWQAAHPGERTPEFDITGHIPWYREPYHTEVEPLPERDLFSFAPPKEQFYSYDQAVAPRMVTQHGLNTGFLGDVALFASMAAPAVMPAMAAAAEGAGLGAEAGTGAGGATMADALAAHEAGHAAAYTGAGVPETWISPAAYGVPLPAATQTFTTPPAAEPETTGSGLSTMETAPEAGNVPVEGASAGVEPVATPTPAPAETGPESSLKSKFMDRLSSAAMQTGVLKGAGMLMPQQPQTAPNYSSMLSTLATMPHSATPQQETLEQPSEPVVTPPESSSGIGSVMAGMPGGGKTSTPSMPVISMPSGGATASQLQAEQAGRYRVRTIEDYLRQRVADREAARRSRFLA